MGQIEINRKKSIGDVVFILEGKDDEFRLFTNIFEKIFSITIIKCRSQKTDLREYILPENRDSVVYLLNAKSSAIKSIDDKEYINLLFNKINGYFKIDISNAAVYYIWDRDKDTNKYDKVKSLLERFQNSRDNGYEMQGLLLLSYPSIESFSISCFETSTPEIEIKDIKKYLTSHKYNYNRIDENKLINAVDAFLKRYKTILNKDFSLIDVDVNMKDNNIGIFDYEEKYYIKNKFYYYFSCIIISLLDLGLIELID